MHIIKELSKDLSLSELDINSVIETAKGSAHIFYVEKRSGGHRKICHPSGPVKVIQYWLNENIFKSLPVHSASAAYGKGMSIRKNADRHVGKRYFVNVDIKNFFPSIKYGDLHGVLSAEVSRGNLKYFLDDDFFRCVNNVCFDEDGGLSIGYPTSPFICNAVMFGLDEQINSVFAKEFGAGSVVYSRYADDMTLSTNIEGISSEIIELISLVLKTSQSPNLVINKKKVFVGSALKGNVIVNGLRVCGGEVKLDMKKKKHITLLIKLFESKKLKAEDVGALQGMLSYAKDVDPAFYTKLSLKYFHSFQKIFYSKKDSKQA